MSGKGKDFWQNMWNELHNKYSKRLAPLENKTSQTQIENEINQRVINKMLEHYAFSCYFTNHGDKVKRQYLLGQDHLHTNSIYQTLGCGRGNWRVSVYDNDGGMGEHQLINQTDPRYKQAWDTFYSPVDIMLKRIQKSIFWDDIIYEDGDVHQILQVICQKTQLNLDDFNFNIQPRPSLFEYVSSCFTACYASFFSSSEPRKNNTNEEESLLKNQV